MQAESNRKRVNRKRVPPAVLLAAALALIVPILASCSPRATGSRPHSDLPWMTDLPAALDKARAENKLVLIDFTGSDWCPPCQKLYERVFATPEFAAYANEHLVLVELDFPRRKEQPAELREANRALAKEFAVEGFPTVIVLNPDRKELKRDVGYGGAGAADFIEDLKKLKPQASL